MNNDLPVIQETLTEQLEREAKAIIDKIGEREREAERLKNQNHWDRKRLKLVESQLFELKNTKIPE